MSKRRNYLAVFDAKAELAGLNYDWCTVDEVCYKYISDAKTFRGKIARWAVLSETTFEVDESDLIKFIYLPSTKDVLAVWSNIRKMYLTKRSKIQTSIISKGSDGWWEDPEEVSIKERVS